MSCKYCVPHMSYANDLDRGLGKVRLYVNSALFPQHKNREKETLASGVADTADETEARLKLSQKHYYEGKKMGSESTVRNFNHRICGTKAESRECTKRCTQSGHPTTSSPQQRPDCTKWIALSTRIPSAISSSHLMGGH